MNISIQSTNMNQQLSKSTFKGFNTNQPIVKEAVGLMADVRCSYTDFEPLVLKRVMTSMKQRLQNVLNHQNKSGEMIFGTSEVNAINGKIASLQKEINAKLNFSA